MTPDTTDIRKMIASGNYDDAAAAIDALICSGDPEAEAEAYYLRGRMAWKLGKKGDAISNYAAAVDLTGHAEAAVALEQAREIMNFFNKDLYNP